GALVERPDASQIIISQFYGGEPATGHLRLKLCDGLFIKARGDSCLAVHLRCENGHGGCQANKNRFDSFHDWLGGRLGTVLPRPPPACQERNRDAESEFCDSSFQQHRSEPETHTINKQ